MPKPFWQGDDGSAPHSWSDADNWDTGAVPANGDSAHVQNSAVGIWQGLAQSAVTLAELHVPLSMTGVVGGTGEDANTLGSNYLDIGATLVYIGAAGSSPTASTGSGRVKHNAGSVACTWLVYNTGDGSSDLHLPPVRLKGTNADNKLVQFAGHVGVAVEDPDETATLSEWSVAGANATLTLGAGVTWATGYVTGGTVYLNSGGTTLSVAAGTVNLWGTGVVRSTTTRGTVNHAMRPLPVSVSGITRSGTTATVTTAAAHGYATGDTVYVAGSDQAGYRGFKTITVTDTDEFTFATDDGDETPATGTITALRAFELIEVPPGGSVDFAVDPRDVAVKTLRRHGGGSYRFNAANPDHVIVGTLDNVNCGSSSVE